MRAPHWLHHCALTFTENSLTENLQMHAHKTVMHKRLELWLNFRSFVLSDEKQPGTLRLLAARQVFSGDQQQYTR